MSNILQFPMPEPTPISPDPMMDFAMPGHITSVEELISLNDWMVKLVQALDDLE